MFLNLHSLLIQKAIPSLSVIWPAETISQKVMMTKKQMRKAKKMPKVKKPTPQEQTMAPMVEATMLKLTSNSRSMLADLETPEQKLTLMLKPLRVKKPSKVMKQQMKKQHEHEESMILRSFYCLQSSDKT